MIYGYIPEGKFKSDEYYYQYDGSIENFYRLSGLIQNSTWMITATEYEYKWMFNIIGKNVPMPTPEEFLMIQLKSEVVT